MTEGWILIDTSAWIHALRPSGNPAMRRRIHDILLEGRAATCEMIVLELVSGARTDKEYRELREDLSALQQFPITGSVWKQACESAHALRRKGISIPAADQLIASVAFTYSCFLMHADKHFELLARHLHHLSFSRI